MSITASESESVPVMERGNRSDVDVSECWVMKWQGIVMILYQLC